MLTPSSKVLLTPSLKNDIEHSVNNALCEDLGISSITQLNNQLDITAALIPANNTAVANIITRENCIVCGVEWVNQVFKVLDQVYQQNNTDINIEYRTKIKWFVADGDYVTANTPLFEISGNARLLLTGERSALNFLQLLSGTATVTHQYVACLANTKTKLLDTRKTIPGLRSAQKYAVKCGGGVNHRIGLFDAFLIKENHIAACGDIEKAITAARTNHSDKTVEVEVESINELTQALNAKADIIMLDNFTPQMIEQAMQLRQTLAQGHTKLEVSGNMTLTTLAQYAKAGVDFISVGALTKHVNAVDLSMRFLET